MIPTIPRPVSLGVPAQYDDRGIYAIVNTQNGKFYLGSAKRFGPRWREHTRKLRGQIHHSQHLQAAWNKWGEPSFTTLLLERVDNEDALLSREEEWLKSTRPFDRSIGYNVCESAIAVMRGRMVSESTRQKISKANLGKKCGPRSPEYCMHMSEQRKGKPLPDKMHAAALAANTGRPCSIEKRLKISQAQKGRPGYKWTDEQKQRASESRRGRPGKPLSDQAKAKLSAVNLGKKRGPMSEAHRAALSKSLTGRIFSEEWKRNISIGKSRPWTDAKRRSWEDGKQRRQHGETNNS